MAPEIAPVTQGTSSYRKIILDQHVLGQIAAHPEEVDHTLFKKTWEDNGYMCGKTAQQDFIDLARPKPREWGDEVLSNPRITTGIKEFAQEAQVSEKVLFSKGSGIIVLRRRMKDLELSYQSLIKIVDEEFDSFLTDKTNCGLFVRSIVPKGNRHVHELAIQSDDDIVIPTADDIRNMKIAWMIPTWNLPQRDRCMKFPGLSFFFAKL